MSTIFMDESGYTGEDLMNSDQPLFALATLCCSEQKCSDYKTEFFSKVQAPELKHKILLQGHRQNLILGFLKELSQTPEIVKLHVAHKRYTLTDRIVQLVVSPGAMKRVSISE